MDPESILHQIDEKDTISLEEAEQGILACLLKAVEQQVERDVDFLENVFNKAVSEDKVERFFRSELKDIIYKHERDHGSLNSRVLEEAVEDINDRVSVDSWDDDIAERHKNKCNEIISKT